MKRFRPIAARLAIAGNMQEMGRGGLQDRVRALVLDHPMSRGSALFYHTWNAKKSAPGFPDCVIVLPMQGRTIFAELKKEKGKLSDPQKMWLSALADAGQEVYLWRPTHLILGKIFEVLDRPGGAEHGRILPGAIWTGAEGGEPKSPGTKRLDDRRAP